MNHSIYIFDLDGTILDTLSDLASSLRHVLRANGLPEKTNDEVRSFVGNGIKKLIERSTSEEAAPLREKLYSDFTEYYSVHCMDETKPYEGIVSLLLRLKEEGCLLAVVSNKDDYAVKALCRRFFPGIFDAVSGATEALRKKPYPDTVNKVLEELHADRKTAVYIGDSDVDVATAENAGMECISVTWGFRSYDFLKEHGAKVFAVKPEDILSL